MSDEKSCGKCAWWVEVPLTDAKPGERIGVCEFAWRSVGGKPGFAAIDPESVPGCRRWVPARDTLPVAIGSTGYSSEGAIAERTAALARCAATDEQFARAVHDGRAWKPVRTCRVTMCYDERDDLPAYYRDYRCDACGETHTRYKNDYFEFCPHCGAKVVSE